MSLLINTALLKPFTIITGGPGSGKTTLINTLAAKGYQCSVEAGRAIIQTQQASVGGALPWHDPVAFANQMLDWEIASYQQALKSDSAVFFLIVLCLIS